MSTQAPRPGAANPPPYLFYDVDALVAADVAAHRPFPTLPVDGTHGREAVQDLATQPHMTPARQSKDQESAHGTHQAD